MFCVNGNPIVSEKLLANLLNYMDDNMKMYIGKIEKYIARSSRREKRGTAFVCLCALFYNTQYIYAVIGSIAITNLISK